MLTGDNPTHGRRGRPRNSASTMSRRRFCPTEKPPMSRSCSASGGLSPWPATASTMRRRSAAADVGIAMGTGTDVAIASAGITLVKATSAASCARVSSQPATMRNIRQNLFFAFLYNALGVPIAAGVLYPCSACCSAR